MSKRTECFDPCVISPVRSDISVTGECWRGNRGRVGGGTARSRWVFLERVLARICSSAELRRFLFFLRSNVKRPSSGPLRARAPSRCRAGRGQQRGGSRLQGGSGGFSSSWVHRATTNRREPAEAPPKPAALCAGHHAHRADSERRIQRVVDAQQPPNQALPRDREQQHSEERDKAASVVIVCQRARESHRSSALGVLQSARRAGTAPLRTPGLGRKDRSHWPRLRDA